MMRWFILFLLLLIIPYGSAVTVTRDCFNCSNCTAAVMASGSGEKVRLMDNLSASGSCIMFTNVTAVTIDCNGKRITGDGCGDEYGISNYDFRSGAGSISKLVIKDCPYIGGFENGIWLDRIQNFTILNVTYFNNEIYGVYAQQSNNTIFIDNHNINLRNSNLGGIAIFDGRGASIHNSTSVGVNGSGLKISGVLGGNSSVNLAINNFTAGNCTASGMNFGGNRHFNSSITNIRISDNDINGLSGNFETGFIQNVTAKNNGMYALSLNDTEFSSVSNILIENSRGLNLDGGQDLILWNITVANSAVVGISLSDHINTTLYEVVLDGEGKGLWNSNCTNGSLYDTSISDFSKGLYIQDTQTMSYENLTLDNNEYGIYMYKASANNTITNSTITGGTKGFYLVSSGADYPKDNIIYNNLFNNTYSVLSNSANNANLWNVSVSPGINIIGGLGISGNYWAKPDGVGWSETCIDADGDRYCDTQYDMSTSNTDFNPLKVFDPYLCEGCIDCSNKITAASPDETIWMALNITSTGQCINMSPNINFSCDGYFLLGPSDFQGIVLDNDENTTVMDCNLGSLAIGINVSSSNNTMIVNTSVYGSTVGISLNNGTENCTLSGNRIYNDSIGLELNDAGGFPQNNLIYNNLFNNTVNVFSTNESNINLWNITLSAGVNILGGNVLGGNLWLKPNGSGWSENCLYDGTGFCPVVYNVSTNNTDLLPLFNMIPPQIVLHSPNDARSTTTSWIRFNWTVDDYENITCRLVIDATTYNYNLTNDTSFSVLKSPGIGVHKWNVSCWASDNFTYHSVNRTLTIKKASSSSSSSPSTSFYFPPVNETEEPVNVTPIENISQPESGSPEEIIEEIETPVKVIIKDEPKKKEGKTKEKAVINKDKLEVELDYIIDGIQANVLESGPNATIEIDEVQIDLGLNNTIMTLNISAKDMKLDGLKLYFNLNKSYINKTIVMSRLNGTWKDLRTEVLKVDDVIYYVAYSDGLSYFSIREIIEDVVESEIVQHALTYIRLVLMISYMAIVLMMFYLRDRYSHDDVIKTSVGKIDLSILNDTTEQDEKEEKKKEDHFRRYGY